MPEVSPFSPSILLYPTGLFTAARLAVRLTQHETSVHAKLNAAYLRRASDGTASRHLRFCHTSPGATCFSALLPCALLPRALLPCALLPRALLPRALLRVPCSTHRHCSAPAALPPTPSPSSSAAPLAHPHSLRPHLTCLPSHLLPVPPPRAPPPPPPHFPTHRLPLHLAQQTHSNMFVIVLALVFCAQANAMDNEGQKSLRGTVRSLAQLSIPVGQDP